MITTDRFLAAVLVLSAWAMAWGFTRPGTWKRLCGKLSAALARSCRWLLTTQKQRGPGPAHPASRAARRITLTDEEARARCYAIAIAELARERQADIPQPADGSDR